MIFLQVIFMTVILHCWMYLLWHLCVLKITAANMPMYFLHSSDSELLHHWLQSLEN